MYAGAVSYPRVLIVCESPFGLDNGFGVTLTNLFEGWPSDRLAVFFVNNNYQPSSRVCYFQQYARAMSSPRRLSAIPFVLGIRPEWRSRYSGMWLKRSLRRYKPDLVYTFLHTSSTLRFGHWMAQRLSIPHVIHVGDDGLGSDISTSKLVHCAADRFAISKPMVNEYRNRYGLEFSVFHNGASPDYFRGYRERVDPGSPRLIRYLGRLHSWLHFDSLKLLREAIEVLDKKGLRWKVELYGSANLADLDNSGLLGSGISYHGQVSRDEGISLLHDSDLLVLPLSYSLDELTSYQYSLPTKLAEYLATGVPVLVLSDPRAASAVYCQANSVAHLIDKPSVSEIVQYLQLLSSDVASGLEQGRRNQLVARTKLNQQTITAEFHEKLIAASAKPCSVMD
jgi:glycosyltransferase involved in cell wall biosynthesis